MTPQEIEQKILNVLAQETTAVGISDKLFTPDGLFSLLASTKEERQVLVHTPLFMQAQQRFRNLQFKEAEEFQQAVSKLQGSDLEKNYTVKIERAKTA